MSKRLNLFLVGVVAVSAATLTTGCDNFLEVDEPDVIDAGTVDPVADASTFAQSALNNLYDALDNLAVNQAWFTGEAWVGDTFTERQDFAKRTVDISNAQLTLSVFQPVALAIASGEQVQELLAEVPDADRNINIARATFASAYAIELAAETFCQVVISSGLDNLGSPITPEAASLEAVDRFQRVISIATANGSAEAMTLANAARVGMARAYLQADRLDEAIAAAREVPEDFEFLAPRVDDPADRNSRFALNNTVYGFTLARPSLVVPPYYRALDDPRVPFELVLDKGQPAKTQGLDLDFYAQRKYTSYADNIRLASALEARYIIAEAQLKKGDPAAAQALIAERRIPTANDGDDIDFVANNSTLTELLDQKARDFYLEAMHMGDWMRNPQATPYVLPAGQPVYFDATKPVGTQTCFPLPDDEIDNNPNFP